MLGTQASQHFFSGSRLTPTGRILPAVAFKLSDFRRFGAQGGQKRAANMTAEERSRAASEAAKARYEGMTAEERSELASLAARKRHSRTRRMKPVRT